MTIALTLLTALLAVSIIATLGYGSPRTKEIASAFIVGLFVLAGALCLLGFYVTVFLAVARG